MKRQFILRMLANLFLLLPWSNAAQAYFDAPDFLTVEELAENELFKAMPWNATKTFADDFIKLKGETDKRMPVYFTSPDTTYKLIYDSDRAVADAERVVKKAFSNYRYKSFWDGLAAQKCKGIFAGNKVLLVPGIRGEESVKAKRGACAVPGNKEIKYFVVTFPEGYWKRYKRNGAADFEKKLRTNLAHEFGHIIFGETQKQHFDHSVFSGWERDYVFRLRKLTDESVAVYSELLHSIVESANYSSGSQQENIELKKLLADEAIHSLYQAYLLMMIDFNVKKKTWTYSFNRLEEIKRLIENLKHPYLPISTEADAELALGFFFLRRINYKPVNASTWRNLIIRNPESNLSDYFSPQEIELYGHESDNTVDTGDKKSQRRQAIVDAILNNVNNKQCLSVDYEAK